MARKTATNAAEALEDAAPAATRKIVIVIALQRRQESATLEEMNSAPGWQLHPRPPS